MPLSLETKRRDEPPVSSTEEYIMAGFVGEIANSERPTPEPSDASTPAIELMLVSCQVRPASVERTILGLPNTAPVAYILLKFPGSAMICWSNTGSLYVIVQLLPPSVERKIYEVRLSSGSGPCDK